MHSSGHTLVPVVGFPRSRGEGSILQEERLVSGKSVLEEVCFLSLILSVADNPGEGSCRTLALPGR